jgi:CDP-6-deoxy-D-xylo-4-hexulose-3-dehydrase
MDTNRMNEMISELAQITPKYAYNCKEFVPGKTPVYYSGPYWDHREMEAILKAVLTGAWITSGAQVERFQRKFSEKFNVKHSHMVNSGSSANLVMIAALKKRLGWEDGDEVIVSPVGFPTTIAPLVQNGLKPVFIDIEMDTLNFDLTKIEEKITDRTVAIFVSPVLGNPCNLDYIENILMLHKLHSGKEVKLIGDNCDSLGSRWLGSLITDHYYAWSCSFYPAHHISTGEGGMICSNDEEVVNEARSISWWGRDCKCVGAANLLACGSCGNRFDTWLGADQGIVDHKYIFSNMGYNLKPLDLQGAIGCVQLEKIDEIDRLRRENKIKFQSLLEKYVPGIRIAHHNTGADPSWFGVPIIMPDAETKTRFVKYLEDNKIQTRNYFAGNILLHPGYRHLGDYKEYPNANKVMGTVFFVGCPPHYNDDVFAYIEEVLKKWV